jgi:hypothetical protein
VEDRDNEKDAILKEQDAEIINLRKLQDAQSHTVTQFEIEYGELKHINTSLHDDLKILKAENTQLKKSQ